ncbi:MAG: nidogen-like domain-containing protein, partial [Pseudomonadota bacterium]
NLDDGAIQVDVTSVFGAGGVDFFGSSYTDVWINSNGLITFDSANTSYQPSGIGGLNQPAIAPFWSDIDITKGGDIYWDLDPGAGALTVTWLDVRPYDSNNSSTNSFQMVLTDTGDGNFSVEFIYEDIDWAYGGTGSGGGPATAGVTDGGSNDYEVDGSGDGSAVLDWDNEDFDGAGGDEAGVFSVSIVGGVVSSTVEGTEGADVFGLGISDIFGNAVTTGDDVINVAGGDDLVDGAGGDDTILGGSGNDTILSGSWGGGSFTPVYSEQTGASDSFFGSNGNSGFTCTTTSNGPLSTASFGSISGYYLGQSNDTFETHTHTFSQEIAGAQILFNDAQSNEVVSLVLDGQFVNLNTAISEGWVTFDGNGQYLINGSGQITSGSNAASTVVGTLTIDASFTSAQLNYQSNSSGDGVHYEFYVDTNPVAAGSDDDLLDGGADADTFLLDDNFGNDTIVGGETGTDTDIIDASDLADALSFALSGTGEGTFSIGTDTVTFSEIEGFELTDQADSVDASADAGGLSIDAGAGDDTVIGGSGDDTIIGGLGADSLLGGDGADTFVIADGFGADTIQGGEGGTDVDEIDLSALSSGISVAFVDGGAGTIALGGDTIQFSEIESFTLTEQGDVFTATNNDHGVTVDGGSGSDTITGARGDHTLFGGDGDDAIYGGNGQSSIDGGSGNDTVYANFYSVTAKPNSYSGGSGTDTLMIAGTAVGSVAYNINLQTGIDTYNNSYSGFEHIVFGTGNDTVLGDAGDNLFEGGDGSDSLMGALGSDTLIGGEGNDFLSGGEGDDFLKSGQGQDTLDGGDGADTLMNAAGDDSLVGGAGDDLIVATQGSDTLEGGAGQDTLMGGVDGDSLDGGADNDLLLGDLAGVRFNETGNDGIGIATNIADFPTTQLSFELTFSSTADPTGTAALGSYVADSGGASLNLYTQSGSLMIEIGGNVVNTGISTASLFDGNVQTLALTWDSASGALEVYDNGSSAYTGTVAAGASFDQGGTFVLGQYQLNEGSYVVGAEFDGTIYGARIYNDIRTPSEILDSTQGPVADTSDSNLVSNWVADPEFAGFNDLSDNAYTMAMLGDVSLAWSEGADTLIGGSGEDTLYGGGGADSVDGGSGQDSILGGDGDDTIDGGGNTDTIFGGAGDDLIADTGGGASDDTIYGEAGNDTISGGVREDYLDGGDDADTFLIEDGPGNDTLMGGQGNDTLMNSDGDDSLDGGDGDDSIVATGGEDTLRGGAGDDTMDGGADADTFIIEDGFGNDVITGGETTTDVEDQDFDTIDLSA